MTTKPHSYPTLQPAPKPSTGTREPTEAEWAAFGRSLYQLRLDLISLKLETVEKHRQIDNLFNGMRNRRDPDMVEECEFCHGHHVGSCQDA